MRAECSRQYHTPPVWAIPARTSRRSIRFGHVPSENKLSNSHVEYRVPDQHQHLESGNFESDPAPSINIHQSSPYSLKKGRSLYGSNTPLKRSESAGNRSPEDRSRYPRKQSKTNARLRSGHVKATSSNVPHDLEEDNLTSKRQSRLDCTAGKRKRAPRELQEKKYSQTKGKGKRVSEASTGSAAFF